MSPLLRPLMALYCAITVCVHEQPSDPLSSDNSLRAGRAFGYENDLDSTFQNAPRAHTNVGTLEGYWMKSIKGRAVAAFEGVMYGEDTGGENRFRLPLPKKPWKGIRNAKKPSEVCLQLNMLYLFQLKGSEDCLGINIYVPGESFGKSNKTRPPYPVIVFIHGGSWYSGAGSEYGGSYLLEHDVILITINYRLGILGFLSTGDDASPGNMGMKDQQLALRFIYENIAAFNGDPTRITLMGQSSGAASVHFHMLSSQSQKYFSRAVSLSGNAYASWAIMPKKSREYRNTKLASATNCPLSDSYKFVDCLRKMDPRFLVASIARIFDLFITPTVPLGVVIEHDHATAFITEHPDKIYARNGVAKVPYIVSRTADEVQVLFTIFNFFGLNIDLAPSRSFWKLFAPIFLDYQFVAKNPSEITEKINDFYFNGEASGRKGFGKRNSTVYADASTDRIFGYGVHKTIQIHSQVAPTYPMLFQYFGRNTLPHLVGITEIRKNLGISHTDDLSSFFNMTNFFPGYKTTDPEYRIVQLLTSTLANFATLGEPTYTDENGETLRIWSPVQDPRNITFLQIGKEVKMIPEPHRERLKFWENVGLSDIKPFIPLE